MTPTNKNKTISDILEEFWDKRGRHSKLPMYPKIESIAEATQAITQAMLDALPEKLSMKPAIQTHSDAGAGNVIGYNQAIDQMESAIKKMGGSDE